MIRTGNKRLCFCAGRAGSFEGARYHLTQHWFLGCVAIARAGAGAGAGAGTGGNVYSKLMSEEEEEEERRGLLKANATGGLMKIR